MDQNNPFKILNEDGTTKEIKPADVTGELKERIESGEIEV